MSDAVLGEIARDAGGIAVVPGFGELFGAGWGMRGFVDGSYDSNLGGKKSTCLSAIREREFVALSRSICWHRLVTSARSIPRQDLDAYFSVDVETDGPIPGPYSILSLAFVFAGTYDGKKYEPPINELQCFYSELKPISENFEEEALKINGLDRSRLIEIGNLASAVMDNAYDWITEVAGKAEPVLVAYPLSFDWSWIYWYFVRFCSHGSPFSHSRCFDLKTAYAVKAGIPISEAGRSKLVPMLRSHRSHSHHALDDAIEQAEIFANLFLWEGSVEGTGSSSISDRVKVHGIKGSTRQS